jgi:hypothetical protein
MTASEWTSSPAMVHIMWSDISQGNIDDTIEYVLSKSVRGSLRHDVCCGWASLGCAMNMKLTVMESGEEGVRDVSENAARGQVVTIGIYLSLISTLTSYKF